MVEIGELIGAESLSSFVAHEAYGGQVNPDYLLLSVPGFNLSRLSLANSMAGSIKRAFS